MALRLALVALLTLAWLLGPTGCGGGGGGGGAGTAATFSRSFGGPGFDSASAAIATRDGGYLFVGQRDGSVAPPTQAAEEADGDLWITKLDANGELEWQRAIGERSPAATPGRRFQLQAAQRLADGSLVVVGVAYEGAAPGGRDVWVAKYTATGTLLWSREHDSGAWSGFAFSRGPTARGAFADDEAVDVQLAGDGGFVVVARSRADLLVGERIDGGFAPPVAGAVAQTFWNAESALVLRLESDGSLRWQRRFVEGQFGAEYNAHPPCQRHVCHDVVIPGGIGQLRVAAAADGGALLAYAEATPTRAESFTLLRRQHVARLDAAGSLRWSFVDADELAANEVLAVLQTDDPAPGGGARDGVADDGFLVLGWLGNDASVAMHVAADGSRSWRKRYIVQDRDLLRLNAAAQVCFAAADGSPLCRYTLAGSSGGSAVVLGLDDSGALSAGPVLIGDLWRIAALHGEANRTALRAIADTGAGNGQHLLINGVTLAVTDRSADIADLASESARFTSDGRVLAIDDHSRLTLFDAPQPPSAAIQVTSRLALQTQALRGEAAIGVVEVAADAYVVAGHALFAPGSSEHADPWLLRVERGSVIWQRRLPSPDGESGRQRLQAIALSAGGEVLVGGRLGGATRLLALDPVDGRVRWQSAPLAADELGDLRALADGGSVVAGTIGEVRFHPGFGVSTHRVTVTRLDAAGTVSWIREVDPTVQLDVSGRPPERAVSIDVSAHGGFIVASTFGNPLRGLYSLTRLDADGNLLWARRVEQGLGGARSSGETIRVRSGIGPARQLGTFVVGFTESGVSSLGQRNVMLVQHDGTGEVRWAQVYGALRDEALADLVALADGGWLAAGSSDSLGERSEAWLVRIGADGVLAAGCNASLASLPAAAFELVPSAYPPVAVAAGGAPAASRIAVSDTAALALELPLAQARQCLGSAAATGDAPGTTRYELTLSQPGTLGGVVTSTPAGVVCGTAADPAPCTARFDEGSDVFLAVDPGSVFDAQGLRRFLRWENCTEVLAPDATGTPRCRVRMDRNRHVRAVFGAPRDRFALRVVINGSGGVRSNVTGIDCQSTPGGPTQCEALYEPRVAGTTLPTRIILSVFVNATDFQGWGGDCAAFGTAAAGGEVLIDRDKTCTATFTGPPVSHVLSVTTSGLGTGNVVSAPAGISCGATCSAGFGPGQTVRLLATAAADSAFAGWTGCDRLVPPPAGTVPECQVDMNAARQVDANFTRAVGNSYRLEVQVIGDDGIVESSDRGITCTSSGPDCQELYAPGRNVTLAYNLLRGGGSFLGWEGDCASFGTLGSVALVMNGDKRCIARFSSPPPPPPVVLTVNKVGAPALVVSIPAGIDCGASCSAPFARGTTVLLQASLAPNFSFSGWSGCDRLLTGANRWPDCEVTMNASRAVELRAE
jgi:outer membrane protein assembly factor BamB